MMKKILFGLTLVAALASCTEDYTDWAQPQHNDPEAAQTVEVQVGGAPDVDYATLTADSVQLFVPTVAASDATASTTYKVVLKGEDADSYAEMVADAQGRVTAAQLKTAVEILFGKKPVKHVIDMDITSYTVVGGQTIANVAKSTIGVTLTAPFIDSGYWLTGDMAGWNKEGALAFTHQGDGDVYDYPEFQIVFTTTADNQYWKIIPQGNYDNDFWAGGEKGVVGVVTDGDTSMEGNLTTDNPGAGKIEQAGIYRMTINMMDYSYKIEKMEFNQFVYFIGATDGWQAAEQKLESPNFDGVYTGYLYCADPNGWGNEFKFQRVAGSWDNEINSGTFTGGISGDFADGGGNIKATAGEGVYFVEMNLAAGTLKATRIVNMNLVGDFNGWNQADDAQQMTWNATDFCFEITGAGVTANGWKFTANNDWGINLGGESIDNLVANGANLTAVGTTIKLYPTRKTSDKIFCTVE